MISYDEMAAEIAAGRAVLVPTIHTKAGEVVHPGGVVTDIRQLPNRAVLARGTEQEADVQAQILSQIASLTEQVQFLQQGKSQSVPSPVTADVRRNTAEAERQAKDAADEAEAERQASEGGKKGSK